MNELILKLITLLHIIFLLFIFIAPFSNSNYFIMLHIIIIPFIIFHWLLNNNTCSLTLMEKFIRKQINNKEIDDNECFTCRIIHPVYDFVENFGDTAKATYIIVISLWIISILVLTLKIKSGEIDNFQKLFII